MPQYVHIYMADYADATEEEAKKYNERNGSSGHYVLPIGPDVSHLIWRAGTEKPEHDCLAVVRLLDGYHTVSTWSCTDGWDIGRLAVLIDEWAELPERGK